MFHLRFQNNWYRIRESETFLKDEELSTMTIKIYGIFSLLRSWQHPWAICSRNPACVPIGYLSSQHEPILPARDCVLWSNVRKKVRSANFQKSDMSAMKLQKRQKKVKTKGTWTNLADVLCHKHIWLSFPALEMNKLILILIESEIFLLFIGQTCSVRMTKY